MTTPEPINWPATRLLWAKRIVWLSLVAGAYGLGWSNTAGLATRDFHDAEGLRRVLQLCVDQQSRTVPALARTHAEIHGFYERFDVAGPRVEAVAEDGS